MKNIYLIITLSYLSAQMPFNCLFNQTNSLNRLGLQSNTIIDIRYGRENELYIGTGDSLGYVDIANPLSPIFSIVRDELLPEGGIPALKTYKLSDDNIMIVLSGATSIFIEGEGCEPSGTGISWSMDNGKTWKHMPQFIESSTSPEISETTWRGQQIKYKTITTTIENISYDLDVHEDYIYATSWAGGVRRFNYLDEDPQWEVIPLPMDDQDDLKCGEINENEYLLDPVNNDNQKAFSVYATSNTIWVGTAGGINKGIVNIDDCIDWVHYNTEDGLGGDWIIGIIPHKSVIGTRLWLISWDGEPPSPHPLTYTDNGGETWGKVTQFEEQGIIVYNLSFSSRYIMASTDHGLYYSENDGEFWKQIPITSDINGERILSENVYTAVSIGEGITADTLFIGTGDGVSIISTSGETMDNIRFWEPPKPFSAYPNPFFINSQNLVGGYGYVRFIYSNPNESSGKIDVFDFAMDMVIHLNNPNPVTQEENEITWNGQNEYGDKVANGVYFCRLSLNGEYYWTKLAVIN